MTNYGQWTGGDQVTDIDSTSANGTGAVAVGGDANGPIATTGGVAGNYGRFSSPQATTALQQYANASDEATRTAALNTLQDLMVNQMPMVPLMAANSGGEYSTKNWVGWPDDSNGYASGQPTVPTSLDVVLHLTPAK